MTAIEDQNSQIDKDWDAVTVGAGPAGSISAALLAERGWRVLLVERSAWPRDKACGGCLNAGAVELLKGAGLGQVLAGAAELARMQLRLGPRRLTIPLPGGVAIERRELDARLVVQALARGAHFRPQTTARLEPGDDGEARTVHLTGGDTSVSVRARVVLACDGLQGTLLAGESWTRLVTRKPARLGFAATVNGAVAPPGVLSMCVGKAGYVGLVQLAGNRTHVGAALWPEACHAQHGARAVIAQLLRDCGQPELPLEDVNFRGTGPLTSRRDVVAGPRVLAIGDACGYVEPFTGEGLAWAIRGAVEASALLPARPTDWHAGLIAAWQARFESAVRQRQRWCWRLREVLRRPRLASACLTLAGLWPGAPARLARRISA